MKTGTQLGHAGAQAAMERAAKLQEGRAWLHKAEMALLQIARRKGTFTVEDLYSAWDDDDKNVPAQVDKRALGHLVKTAHGMGLIRPTGRYCNSVRRSRHGGIVREWTCGDDRDARKAGKK